MFIDEILANYMKDMTEKQKPSSLTIKELLKEFKKKVSEEKQQTLVGEIEEIEKGFKKTLELSSKY